MKVGDVVAGRYELEELVGLGGMSSVYRAHDRVLARSVALKILHQHMSEGEYVQRFRREAQLVAALSHPNIVTVIDRAERDGRQFIVFEYVEGENLKRLIGRTGPLPVERALGLAIQVARGLAYAHGNGLVHRDVKPQNVLLNGDGQAKVTDFGIARSLDVQQGATVTGTVLGTSEYISPEQAQGLTASVRSDVYSLGVVLYELLTGELPFAGDNFVAIAMKHINDPPPSVRELRPEVPARVAAAVEKALAKNPEDRFPTMNAFGAELEACLAEVRGGEAPEQAEPTDRTVVLPGRARRRGRHRRRAALVVLLVGCLLAAGVAFALVHDSGSGPSGGGGSSAVALRGVGAWDPFGDGTEHDADAPRATDGNPSTFWETERYFDRALGKPGVGLVLDAGSSVTLHRLTITSDTPGFTAELRASSSPDGGFGDPISRSTVIGRETTISVDGPSARYYVVWITALPPGAQEAHVNEVTAG